MTNLFGDAPEECPACGHSVAVAIIYGPPSSEMLIASQLQQIVLGGPEPEGDTTQWSCQSPTCRHAF